MSSSSSSSSITFLRFTDTEVGDDAGDDEGGGARLFTIGDPPTEGELVVVVAEAAAEGASPFAAGALVKKDVIFFIQMWGDNTQTRCVWVVGFLARCALQINE
jgi:hypothetical protein